MMMMMIMIMIMIMQGHTVCAPGRTPSAPT